MNLENYTNKDLESILKNLNMWRWDTRLGKKPFMFDYMVNYKKPNNIKTRLGYLFCGVCPFTKETYIAPAMKEIKKLLANKEIEE